MVTNPPPDNVPHSDLIHLIHVVKDNDRRLDQFWKVTIGAKHWRESKVQVQGRGPELT